MVQSPMKRDIRLDGLRVIHRHSTSNPRNSGLGIGRVMGYLQKAPRLLVVAVQSILAG
jgi:hypothetical protein